MITTVAFQGEHGAYSDQACRQFFGKDVKTIPLNSFQALFEAVHRGDASHVMLPVENSVAGTVTTAVDLLIDFDLVVQGEEIVKVEHCLMAPQGVELKDVKRVISHWQALAQCAKSFERMGIEMVTHYDTAGSARDLAQSQEPHTAALASELSAELYNLNILARDLQDNANNFTRFFVLGKQEVPRSDPSKTSIILSSRDDTKAGALYGILGSLAENNVNMTKLESRPRRNVPWLYRFFIDFEGHEDDDNVQRALTGILRQTSFLKVLGSYPAKKINGN